MGDQEIPEPDIGRGANQQRIKALFSRIKKRAVKSLICSSANVVPIDSSAESPGDAPPSSSQQRNGSVDDHTDSSPVETERTYGVVDLKMQALEVVQIKNDTDTIMTYRVVEEYDPELLANEDEIWEDNMWKKMDALRKEGKPIDFRLYLVDMIRYSANVEDFKSMGIYITQLQREYNIYDNHDKLVNDRASSKGRTKFRVDGVAENLIVRLVNLQVDADNNWKRMVNLICDRLKKNMAPKPKVDVDELPKILFRGKALTQTDITDSWFQYPTIDLTGYDLQGDPEADELRRRLFVYLTLRPIILVKLNLSYTGLDKKTFLPLLPLIASLPSLQELDLRGNRFDQSVLKYFYPYLGRFGDNFRNGFSSLRWVYFNHNQDISCLPTRFAMGIDRRWPPIEHRPTPQELSDNRATVCDFTKIERIRAKLIEKRAQIQKRAKKLKPNISKEREKKEKKKAAFLRRVAAVANQVLKDESLLGDLASPSDLNPLSGTIDPDVDGSDAGRTGRLARVTRRARERAARAAIRVAWAAQAAEQAQAAENQNDNGNNARGNDDEQRQEVPQPNRQDANIARQNRQSPHRLVNEVEDDDEESRDVQVDFDFRDLHGTNDHHFDRSPPEIPEVLAENQINVFRPLTNQPRIVNRADRNFTLHN